MGDTHNDPTDHSRTTQPHAGIAMKDNFFWPGLILLAVATVSLISTAAAAAYRHYEWLSTTILITILGAVAGALWLVTENRHVARIDDQWDASHSGPHARRRPRCDREWNLLVGSPSRGLEQRGTNNRQEGNHRG
ncbi:protein UsfY [Mycobacterium asiaticum]|uniref:protein UsfY n=1 Tax=Mycobacterium asiaticum TaxID=1790 RepID=UPI000B05E37D|nr:protein UsfY [Mycobacterium asiaticum]